MTCKTMLALVIGLVFLLSGGAVAQARVAATSAHVMAPRVARIAPFRNDRAIGSSHAFHPGFDFQRPSLGFDRRFLRTQRRFTNRFGTPFGDFGGYWPDEWPDEVTAPNAPDASADSQPTDSGIASDDSRLPPVSASGSDRTVIRHDFPGYTIFDYCKAQPRELKDCGPEWIVIHPVAAASPTPPAAVVR